VVLGANGAGKTTTMRALAGTIPRRGRVTFLGQDITRRSPEAIVKAGMAMVPEGRGTFPELTVEENLRVGGHARRRVVQADLDRWYDVFPVLAERKAQQAGQLSGGEQQMLAIARALMSEPRLLLCDEPSLGLAPVIVRNLFEVIKSLNAEGLAVLLVEQNANLALEIANRVYVLESGEVVTAAAASELASQDSLRKAYLGY
jgi:branched-chain amino acid transport system ATP-binding protein